MKKMYVVMLAAMLTFSALFAGCGSNKTEDVQSSNVENSDDGNSNADAQDAADAQDSGNSSSSNDGSSILDNLSTAMQAGGRDYGQTYDLTQNDVMHSVFFDLKVNSVATAIDLEDYTLEGTDYVFLIVNVSITNTFDQDDPMSYADFPVLWGNVEDGDGCYPDYEFSTAFPQQYTIAVGETVEGDLIYEVPKNAESVILQYYDLWSDEFEGDTFNMTINVK